MNQKRADKIRIRKFEQEDERKVSILITAFLPDRILMIFAGVPKLIA